MGLSPMAEPTSKEVLDAIARLERLRDELGRKDADVVDVERERRR